MRTLSDDFRDAIESSRGSNSFIFFATITHRLLTESIFVNSDVVDYVYNGNKFVGCAFAITLLTDDEQPPKAQVAIENVDESIGNAIIELPDSPTIKIELMVKSDFDDGIPRQAIGTPTVEYSAPYLRLRNVNCDVMSLTGELAGYDFTTEQWPRIRSTADNLPGLDR